MKYVSHSIKNQHGKFIYGKNAQEQILDALYQGKIEGIVDGKRFTVKSDEMVDGRRVTTVEIEQ